jgi:acetoacetate decarboxylase
MGANDAPPPGPYRFADREYLIRAKSFVKSIMTLDTYFFDDPTKIV